MESSRKQNAKEEPKTQEKKTSEDGSGSSDGSGSNFKDDSDDSEDSDMYKQKNGKIKMHGSIQEFQGDKTKKPVFSQDFIPGVMPLALYQLIFSYMNLEDQMKLCLPLSKSIGDYITENCDAECAKWSKGRQKKLVFHFNSKYAEELNKGTLDQSIIDNLVQLTDIVILEIDE